MKNASPKLRKKSFTIVEQACHEIAGFGKLPQHISEGEINRYLASLARKSTTPSLSDFKFTIYGLRYCYRLLGMKEKVLKLPSIKREKKLPVVLNRAECRSLFKAPELLKHRVLLSLMYSAGLRAGEVSRLQIKDIDSGRMMIHIRRSKYNKDRYVPLIYLHPHVHCIVPGGGLDYSGQWKPVKISATGKTYLFPVENLSRVFRAKFMAALQKHIQLEKPFILELHKTNWVVYAKEPFAGPQQVVEYLGRYTHKVAISNHRLMSVDETGVQFSYSWIDPVRGPPERSLHPQVATGK